ncbi:hypothetical protein [Mangrovihabitans endophyticus]|uniref:Transposase IS116/IS110/IS902 family protein n=1 Tax=Mangrovihabitans endophyticus TaxID=1751298 RepID=A0A8J3BXL0_9ACTN|nr:hypothetical protein [Mangrovihabitans endophyticus]GGK79246.1 hypothetical protein GCM10012284_11590 [Mangrovihabitans endophyticus]
MRQIRVFEMLHVIAYSAMLDVPRELVQHLGRLLAAQRRDLGTWARVLGQIAVSAARTDTFPGERYRRIARRRGAKRAIVAVGRSMLTIIWHLLSAPETGWLPRPRRRFPLAVLVHPSVGSRLMRSSSGGLQWLP